MPYIKEDKRKPLIDLANELEFRCNNKGDVVYAISRVVHQWVLGSGEKTYENLSEGSSILRDALTCYDDTVLLPHEHKKKKENGPVSELDK